MTPACRNTLISTGFNSVATTGLSISELRQMSSIDGDIRHLAREFCKQKLTTNPISGVPCENSEPSHTEFMRVCVAFYMLEHFCCLFKAREWHEDQQFSTDSLWEFPQQFLSAFPAYEAESLKCVTKYIYARLGNIFDPVWSHSSKDPPSLCTGSAQEVFLSWCSSSWLSASSEGSRAFLVQ